MKRGTKQTIIITIILGVHGIVGKSKNVQETNSKQEKKGSNLICKEKEEVLEQSTTAPCFPGFRCVHGTCSAGMSCICDKDYAGMFCQVKCPSDCGSLGKCGTDVSGKATCYCQAGYIYVQGSGCVEYVSSNETTTKAQVTTPANLRSLENRQCFQGFTCVYGYCQVTTFTCVCDRGFVGTLCDQTCSFDCSNHGVCRENDEKITYCVCDEGYTGVHCEINLRSTASPTLSTESSQIDQPNDDDAIRFPDTKSHFSPEGLLAMGNSDWGRLKRKATTSTTTTTTVSTTIQDTTVTTQDPLITTLRPVSERTCAEGFVCLHGKCGGPLNCVCDPGWKGTFCHLGCYPKCEANSTCVVIENRIAECRCRPGLTCHSLDDKSTQPPTIASTLKSVELNMSEIDDPWKPLKGFPELSHLSQRVCSSSFICRYGNCSNIYPPKCSCEKDFQDTFCNIHCSLKCPEYQRCDVSPDGVQYCICDDNKGPNCTKSLASKRDYTWWAVGTAGSALAIIVVVTLITMYVLWRARNVQAMKIVYWFQQFEDEDGREYDAFVSYSSAEKDYKFVVNSLVPRLENNSLFTLCLHQRNWGAGEPILANIYNSVRRSRRTILVITPAFVESVWCKIECQAAFQEMLEQKHKIVPILLDNVNDRDHYIDYTLKSLMKSVTYLEYPKKQQDEKEIERFWKRLELSMPKKRPPNPESPRSSQVSLAGRDPSNKPSSPTLFGDETISPSIYTSPPLYKHIVRVTAKDLNPVDKPQIPNTALKFPNKRLSRNSTDSFDRKFLDSMSKTYDNFAYSNDLNQLYQPSLSPNSSFGDSKDSDTIAETVSTEKTCSSDYDDKSQASIPRDFESSESNTHHSEDELSNYTMNSKERPMDIDVEDDNLDSLHSQSLSQNTPESLPNERIQSDKFDLIEATDKSTQVASKELSV